MGWIGCWSCALDCRSGGFWRVHCNNSRSCIYLLPACICIAISFLRLRVLCCLIWRTATFGSTEFSCCSHVICVGTDGVPSGYSMLIFFQRHHGTYHFNYSSQWFEASKK